MERINSMKNASLTSLRIKIFLGILVSSMASLSMAQTPIVLKRYVCPDATSSSFTYNAIRAEKSDSYCLLGGSDGTRINITVSGATDVGTVTKSRVDDGSPGHGAQIDIAWVPGKTGIIIIDVYYDKKIYKGFPSTKCKWTGNRYMYTYEIHREYVSPGGVFAGADVATASGNESVSTFNLTYSPTTSAYLTSQEWMATKIRYQNGRDAAAIETPIVKSENNYLATPVTYYTTGKGAFVLQSEVYAEVNGQCGQWYPVPPKTLNVYSSCYQDDVSVVDIHPVGLTPHLDDGSYTVQTETEYSLEVVGITDFSSHFTWSTNGGTDITLSDNTFTVHKTTGSYRIEAIPNDQGCPVPKALKILTGGQNTTIDYDCSIVVPEYFSRDPFNFQMDDIIFHHFATHLQSKRSIVVMPGVTLDLGAELSLEVTPISENSDLQMNFTQQKSFDEYGRLLSESRSYFDDRGQPLQTQYKNISDQVILANAVVYDAYGRQVISTLAAPVLADPSKSCPIDDQDGLGMLFSFKENFINGPTGKYNYKDFDLTNESSPVAVDAAEEGTLGWYYSANNGNTPASDLHEPQVATTQYPYSRTLYHHDGSGNVKGVTKPGDAFKAGSTHLPTADQEPVAVNDPYFNTDFNSYLSIRERDLALPRPASVEGEFFRNVAIDGSGKKSVAYTDKSGHTIISLYFGDSETPITKSYQFYDNAGRLLASISPNGLNQYAVDQNNASNFNDIDKTRYFYNNKGRLSAVEEKTAGQASNGISRTEYVYRRDGKIRFSQNQVQRTASSPRYSYTNYDDSGRPIESGEFEKIAGGVAFNSAEMKNILETTTLDGGIPENSGTKTERTFTYYDETYGTVPLGRIQRFVHGAVSATKKDNIITTWYSYDERGRVEWMIQDITGFGIKTLDYRYGPTGQVQEVVYQRGVNADQFTHFYEYDQDGRIHKVFTTRELLVYDKLGKLTNTGITYNSRGEILNPGVLEHQATYSYYLHGPLKRVELATRQRDTYMTLQGIDYVYTADGALKSINHADTSKDPGGDGTTRQDVRPDVFGMTLEYYPNDYTSAKDEHEPITITGDYDDQYTGLIKSMRWHSPTLPDKQFAYVYNYDERNQFTKADWGTVTAGVFATNSLLKPYHESIGGYDANGNIASLQRNANILKPTSNFTYDLSYNYKPMTNMLQSITKGQGQNAETFRSYVYDDLGQMTKETEGGESKFVVYDLTGKVTGVYADENHTQPITTYVYDDRGFRLSKTSYGKTFLPSLLTFYVRDASGNIVSTYEKVIGVDQDIRPTEMPVYGSGRIGLYKPVFGITLYEINDHLGNVRAVIGEKLTAEYMATMETERNAKEIEDFEKVNPSPTSQDINHTPQQVVVDGQTYDIANNNEVLRMNNRPAGELHPDPIGTGIMLPVHPGDVIDAEVFAKYANFNVSNNNPVGGLSSFLYNAFKNTSGGVDISSIFNVVETPGFGAMNVWSKLDDTQPKAFLNYLLFDNDFNLQQDDDGQGGFDFDQVSSAAEITEVPSGHERLSLENIMIQKEGFIYIYVSNESDQNMDVYFDDLKVIQHYSDIVAGGDFYPFGLAINDRQINRDAYRHGYEGKFSEKDDETGWNHFELREFDPVIGRWLQKDPAGQYNSPYVGMGNNPVNSIDPNGGFEVPIHVAITYYAAGSVSLNLKSDNFKELVRGVKAADYLGFAMDYHFDNRSNYIEIIDNWVKVNDRMNSTKSYRVMGTVLHTVQDFYAHSNYAILYADWYAKNNDYNLPTSIPTFDEALKMDGFRDVLQNDLKTGRFNLVEWAIQEKLLGKFLGPDSHQAMNLDDAEGYLGRLARTAAEQHSAQMMKEFEDKNGNN
jgi:RHS repeat-associated protein